MRNKKTLKKIFSTLGIGIVFAGSIFLVGCSEENLKTIPYNWTSISTEQQFVNLMENNVIAKDGTPTNKMKGYMLEIESSACPICRSFRDLSDKEFNYFQSHQREHNNQWWTNWLNNQPKGNGILNKFASDHNAFSIYIPGYNIDDPAGFPSGSDPTYGWVTNLKEDKIALMYQKSGAALTNLNIQSMDAKNVSSKFAPQSSTLGAVQFGWMNNLSEDYTNPSAATWTEESLNTSTHKYQFKSVNTSSDIVAHGENGVAKYYLHYSDQKKLNDFNKKNKTSYKLGWNKDVFKGTATDAKGIYGNWPISIFIVNNDPANGYLPYVAGLTQGKYKLSQMDDLSKTISKNLGFSNDIFAKSSNKPKTSDFCTNNNEELVAIINNKK